MGLETTSIKEDRLSGIPQLSLIASYLRELCNRELIPSGYGQISNVILPHHTEYLQLYPSTLCPIRRRALRNEG